MCVLCNDSRGCLNRRVFLRGATSGIAVAYASGLPALAFAQTGKSALTVTDICNRFVDDYATVNPLMIGRVLGVGRDSPAVTDWSPTGAEATIDLMKSTLADLEATPPINQSERLGAGYLRDTAEAIMAMYDSGENLQKVSTSLFVGPQAILQSSFDLMNRAPNDETPIELPGGDTNWARIAQRMRGVPDSLAGYRKSLEEGMSQGKVGSRRMALAVADQCEGIATNGWFNNFARGYSGGGALEEELSSAANAAGTAYGDLGKWFRDTYAPKAAEADGVGGDRYQLYARLWLGFDRLDLDEAYEWAVEEYSRLEAEKAKEANRIKAGASFDEVQQLLNSDPSQSIEGVDAFRAWAQDLIDEAISKLSGKEFDLPEPMRRVQVQMVQESGAGAMPFYLSTAEGSAEPPGVVWPTLGQTRLPTWNAKTTVYHESVPGHHIQIGGARFLDLTRVQRLGVAPGHAEGWALYAERLADELGWFDTPQTRLGFLSMQSFRAARVFVDIGLHTGLPIPAGFEGAGEPWTFDRAVDVIAQASGFGRDTASLEVMRYLAWPAQAPCYKLGERTWLAARADAVAREGSNFNRREWHAKALALGPLGLDRLTRELKEV